MSKLDNHNHWDSLPKPALTRIQKRWLMRAGALTSGLRTFGTLKLRVLNEYPAGLSLDESTGLHRLQRSPVWVREVAMSLNGVDCVVARSVTPLVASHGVWQGVRRLRSRPLADILYQDRSISRSAFEVTQVIKGMPIHRTARLILKQGESDSGKALAQGTQRLLARRSTFWREKTPLLVAECFLPAFWMIASDQF